MHNRTTVKVGDLRLTDNDQLILVTKIVSFEDDFNVNLQSVHVIVAEDLYAYKMFYIIAQDYILISRGCHE
jgi:hypothetical protein